MKLGHKLLLAPLLTGLIALAGGGLNALLMHREAAASAVAFAGNLDQLRTITQVQDQLGRIHASAYRAVALIASLDEPALKAFRADLRSQVEGADRVVHLVAGGQADGAPLRALVHTIHSALARYGQQADNAVDMASVDPNTGVAAMQNADATFKTVSQTMADIVVGIGAAAEQTRAAASQRARQTTALLGAASVLATLATLLLCGLMLRRVMAALRRAAALALAVSQGDLAVPEHNDHAATRQRDDEIGDLQRALDQMVTGLRESIHTVQLTAQQIAGAGAEIATGNQDLSQRTDLATGNLQQTAASLHQLSTAVHQSAAAAAQASQLAQSAAEVAQRGGIAVGQVVATMDDINQASRRIADIVITIDGIAFQTNILALNAAVEAARAGEQGRGFAVVAGEVRSLAQRSAAAAREIKGLIGSNVEKVATGARQVREAGATMTEIVHSVQGVAGMISQITAAAAEQSKGIGQVSGAVSSLDHMTGQNAALVQQSAAAAEHLSAQARTLADIVARFHLHAG